MAMELPGACEDAHSEPPTWTALVLEMVALRHQIAVLKRSGTRRPCFRFRDRCFGFCWRGGGRFGVTAWWSSSRRRFFAGAAAAGWDCGSIVHEVVGAVDGPESPERFASSSSAWCVRIFCGEHPGFTANCWCSGLPSRRPPYRAICRRPTGGRDNRGALLSATKPSPSTMTTIRRMNRPGMTRVSGAGLSGHTGTLVNSGDRRARHLRSRPPSARSRCSTNFFAVRAAASRCVASGTATVGGVMASRQRSWSGCRTADAGPPCHVRASPAARLPPFQALRLAHSRQRFGRAVCASIRPIQLGHCQSAEPYARTPPFWHSCCVRACAD